MAREIIIDSDTLIGYNYPIGKYYVTNQNTTTYRADLMEAKNVLNIVAPSNTVTIYQLKSLQDTLETLTSLSYTLSDTGAYFATIQFNDYKDYALVLDCEKSNMYIMNTDTLFDLRLNESAQSRIKVIQAYYLDKLGLDLTVEQLTYVYDYMISFYSPTVYNVITDTDSTPVKYSNIFALSNFNNKAIATYMCTCNPNNVFNNIKVEDIVSTDSNTNTINLLNNISSTLKVGDTVTVSGTTLQEETYNYSADGTYTIKSILDSYSILTNETIGASYSFPYPTCYAIVSEAFIESISRDDSTITLTTEVPNTYNVGDIIYVTGTSTVQDYQSVTADGEYIIAYIQGKVIGVQQQPLTNYTAPTTTASYTYKRINLGNVILVQSNTLTFQDTIPNLSTSTKVVYTYNKEQNNLTVKSVTSSKYMEVNESVEDFTPVFPVLYSSAPNTSILIDTLSTTKESKFPVGKFIVDNFTQCQDYINILIGLPSPSNIIYNSINKEPPSSTTIHVSLPTAKYLGIFSQVYKQE